MSAEDFRRHWLFDFDLYQITLGAVAPRRAHQQKRYPMTKSCMEVVNLYKIFDKSPQRAMQMLAAGATKERVLAETGAVVGLNNVSLTIPTGATYVIMGLSGSGKSTLARCINRLNEPTAGKILLDGRDIVAANEDELRDIRRTRISMVFQHFALLPNKSVIENVEFGLKMRGIAPKQRRARAEEMLAVVGLARWGSHMPHELSGGMRQRVGLARALATDADVLIMDEAFSALDPLIRAEMQDELLRLQQTLNKTILFITHDFQEALKIGSRIAIMADGEVVREGTPQSIVLDPGSKYVAAFTREVDRARLFDAGSVMDKVTKLMTVREGEIVGAAGGSDEFAFVLDGAGRVIGTLTKEGMGDARAGGEIATPSGNYVSVWEHTKLVDVARLYRDGQPVGVTDLDGKLIGVLGPQQILACIASPQPAAARYQSSEGAR